MWENANPAQPKNARDEKREKKKQPKRSEDLILWAQTALCVLAIAGVLAAKHFGWPVYKQLRQGFAAAMQPEQELFLNGERSLLKFAELPEKLGEEAASLTEAAKEVLADLRLGETATAEQARPAHSKASKTPSNAKDESYEPAYPFVFPLPGKIYTKTSGYGWRTDPMGGQGTDYHTGADLAVSMGTPVLAAADGVVKLAGWHNSYGNYIRILHPGGDETLYAHMQYLFVRTGQPVKAGQTLGTVGQTGNSTGPHLHFETLKKGIRYDPTTALQNAPAAAY